MAGRCWAKWARGAGKPRVGRRGRRRACGRKMGLRLCVWLSRCARATRPCCERSSRRCLVMPRSSSSCAIAQSPTHVKAGPDGAEQPVLRARGQPRGDVRRRSMTSKRLCGRGRAARRQPGGRASIQTRVAAGARAHRRVPPGLGESGVPSLDLLGGGKAAWGRGGQGRPGVVGARREWGWLAAHRRGPTGIQRASVQRRSFAASAQARRCGIHATPAPRARACIWCSARGSRGVVRCRRSGAQSASGHPPIMPPTMGTSRHTTSAATSTMAAAREGLRAALHAGAVRGRVRQVVSAAASAARLSQACMDRAGAPEKPAWMRERVAVRAGTACSS